METNWDLLIENHFDKKETLAMDMLVEMVEDLMSENISNRGDVAEGLIACAIVAKLAARKPGVIPPIDKDDVWNIVQTLKGNGDELEMKVQGAKSGIVDTIKYTVGLPKAPFSDLVDPNKRHLLESEYASALKYANEEVQELAEAMYGLEENSVIKVSAEGTKDQKGQKADIFVYYPSEEEIERALSAKAGKTEQLDQTRGIKFDAVKKLFSKWDVDIEPLRKQYDEILKDIPQDLAAKYQYLKTNPKSDKAREFIRERADWSGDISNALLPIYKAAEDQYKRDLNNKRLADIVATAATGKKADKENALKLLKLVDGDYKLVGFGEKFAKAMEAAKFEVELDKSKKYPYLVFNLVYDDPNTGEEVKERAFQIRPKVEIESKKVKEKDDDGKVVNEYKTYYWLLRNYVEGGPALLDLAKL
jgi:hypothetical protein